MKLASVVVFYNPTMDNIKNLDNYQNNVDVIYVIDNSEDAIKRVEDTSKIKYIKLGKNEGIAYALNIGATKAIADGYKWLLTLDQDSKITSSNIEEMKKFINENASNKKIGLISPYQNIHSGEDDRNGQPYEEKIEVMTSGNIINLSAYSVVSGYKDWFFIDCVDMDFCMNLNKHGYKVIRLNDVVMEHDLGNVIVHTLFGKQYPCYNHSPLRRYYMVRNTFYLKDLYGDLYEDYCNYLIRVQKGQVKRILAFEKKKFQKLKMMYKGYKDYKKGIKGKFKTE